MDSIVKNIRPVRRRDLKGAIKNFPIEVVEEMLKCQVEQGNPYNPKVFISAKSADMSHGGFNWTNTKEGRSFWQRVIGYENFDLFFKEFKKRQ